MPTGFDAIVVQPDGALASDGFYDVLASDPIRAGTIAGLFSVDYLFLGTVPQSQPFDIVDPLTFRTIGSGRTIAIGAPTNPGNSASVPEPASAALMIMGVAGILNARSRRNAMGARRA